MTINYTYIQEYAKQFTVKTCDDYFSQRKYMTGPQMVQLTQSIQVNFFTIKALFEAWQKEVEKLKSNPYFDYRDNAVHEALKEFMNVLSRSIKVERKDFEPLLQDAVEASIALALDPVAFFDKEFDRKEAAQLNTYLKDNKKYYKWHTDLIANLIDRAGISQTPEAFKQALYQNFEKFNEKLEPAEKLLDSMHQVLPIDWSRLLQASQQEKTDEMRASEVDQSENPSSTEQPEVEAVQHQAEALPKESEQEKPLDSAAANYKMAPVEKALDPLQVWSKFEAEEYSIMKGTIKDLSESVGLNQKFMFTKALFQGNPDLMNHALKTIDQCESFADAIELLNQRYVGELNWDKNADEVNELLQLIFRKFDHRN
ncbi:hypothetical protein [Cecembia lonarensis]|uniref:Uncharacterized protein n=1 Tax=Cecembia lonarensis (strain CCUG 58316 / KCTC 22772 / LW9) TaxID=1225176 RepID=K1L5T2_CECL9|nr:hypothetical protein [Cecembia lonarensis]EKB47432.1 hypothetical protein B879_03968 [Cecembia lonarensis LW9]